MRLGSHADLGFNARDMIEKIIDYFPNISELFTRMSKQKYSGREGEDDGKVRGLSQRTLRVDLVGGLPFYLRIKLYMDNDLPVLDQVPDIEDIVPPKR